MPTKNRNLHGNAPDKSAAALLLIDTINDLDFPGSDGLLRHALPMAERLVELKRRAREAGIPVIYVNDNFGRWRSNFSAQVEHCLSDDVPGKPIVELLKPEEEDYFVLKPKHSGFYSTALDVLLEYLGVETVILTGIAGNICVLFTANDAYLRDLNLYVPRDCTASNTEEENDVALDQMATILKADTRPSTELDLRELAGRRRTQDQPDEAAIERDASGKVPGAAPTEQVYEERAKHHTDRDHPLAVRSKIFLAEDAFRSDRPKPRHPR